MFSLKRFHNNQFPRLKHVNALLNMQVSCFAWFNLVLGTALLSQTARTTDFFLLSAPFGYGFWGTYFLLGGVGLFVGQFFNRWTLMRQVLLALIFSKIIWFTALTYRQIDAPSNNIFLLLFFGLALVMQVGMYLYFPVYKKVKSWKR